MPRSGLHGPNVTGVMLARAQQRHDASLDSLLQEIDVNSMQRSGVYYGEPCPTCREDCIPISGRCPWCDELLLDVE